MNEEQPEKKTKKPSWQFIVIIIIILAIPAYFGISNLISKNANYPNIKICTLDTDCDTWCQDEQSIIHPEWPDPSPLCTSNDDGKQICNCLYSGLDATGLPSDTQNDIRNYDFPEITTQENCEAFGATWVLTGIMARKCEKPTPDAGNACKNANDCMRKCIIKNSSDASGTCSDFSQNGCFSFLDEDGQRDGLCIN